MVFPDPEPPVISTAAMVITLEQAPGSAQRNFRTCAARRQAGPGRQHLHVDLYMALHVEPYTRQLLVAANHPAQLVPIFMPRHLETAKPQPSEMSNSVLSHNPNDLEGT